MTIQDSDTFSAQFDLGPGWSYSMFCSRCCVRFPKSATFCVHCGGTLNTRPHPLPGSDVLDFEFSEEGRDPRFFHGWFILPAFAVAAIVIGAVAAFLL